MTEITAEDFGLPEQEYYFEYNWMGIDFNSADPNQISVGASVVCNWQPGSDHVSIEPINTWEPVSNYTYTVDSNQIIYYTVDSNQIIYYTDIHFIEPGEQNYPPGSFSIGVDGSMLYIPEQEDDSDNS